jgi:hypothetical protein
MDKPDVELLWWEGCPSWEEAIELLREQMTAAGLDPDAARVTKIEDETAAERAGFPGSPTILIDGSDLQPPGPDEPRGLTCRVYRRRDGRPSPLPDPDDLREALEKARDR